MKKFSFYICFFLISSILYLQAKEQKVTHQLNDSGKKFEAEYLKEMQALKAAVIQSLPAINEAQKTAYTNAIKSEKDAKAKLDSAQQNLGKVKQAEGLVGHARGKWIGGADKGIAKANEMLKKAKTDAQRDAAQKELVKWQKNREDGLKALKERQAMLDKAKADEPKFLKAIDDAKKELAAAKAAVTGTLSQLKADSLLGSSKLDDKLVKFSLMNEATAAGLAAFAQKGSENKKLLDQLLSNTALMKEMLLADGAQKGQYGQAMTIYSNIQKLSSKANSGHFQRLALAISLEHAVPISQRNPEALTNAAQYIDPVKRYIHYEKAFLNKELDPAFQFLTTWDYRMVVNGNEPDETLAWGREMLRVYRPDQVTMDDYRWRYVAAVKTDIRYGSEDNKYDKDDLQFFQNILMNGGICGRRAFYGRFILRAFGIPTVPRPQKGHAALAHWTPKGWVICLGAGWGSGWAPQRPNSDLDFLEITQARQNLEEFVKVKRSMWIGDVMGEERKYGFRTGNNAPAFWNSLSLNVQKKIIADLDPKILAAVGTDIGEANESRVKDKVIKVSISEEDKKITAGTNGQILIPAAACTKPTNSTGKIKFMKSYLGGMQLHYERNGNAQDFEYTIDVPAAGKYLLSAKVATPTWKQSLLVFANGSKESIEMELPHTVGLWEICQPVTLNLNKGKNVLKFSRGSENPEAGKRHKGVTIKEFTLKPLGN